MKDPIIPEKITMSIWIGTLNMKPMSITMTGKCNNLPIVHLVQKDILLLRRLCNIMNTEYISWKD